MEQEISQATAESSSIVEPAPLSEPPATITLAKRPKSKTLMILVILLVLVVLAGAAGVFALYFYGDRLGSLFTTDNTKTTVKPTVQLKGTPTVSDNSVSISTANGLQVRDQSMLYELDGYIYKLNLTTLEKTKVDLGKQVHYGGGSVALGNTGPALSPNAQFLASTADGQLSIYDLLNKKTHPITLPVPAKGNVEIWLGGFSKDSQKLLYNIQCQENMGDAVNFVDCDQAFSDTQTGYRYYDLVSGKEQKVNDSAKYLKNYSGFIGWAQYSADLFLVTRDNRDSGGSLKSIDLTEINPVTGTSRVFKTLTAPAALGKFPSLEVSSVDASKNILYAMSGGTSGNNSWDLYFTNESAGDNPDMAYNAGLVKHMAGWTTMQQPALINGDSTKAIFYSDDTGKQIVHVVNVNGTSVLEESIPFTGDSHPSYLQYGSKYVIEHTYTNGVNVIERDSWKTVINLPSIKNSDGTLTDANVIF